MRSTSSRAASFVVFVVALLTCRLSFAEEKNRDEQPALVTHDDTSFKLESKDKKFELRLFGIVQADFRDYLRKSDRSDYDRFLVRRARPYIEGHVMGDFDYRLMMDLGQGEVDLLDAFIDAKLFGKALRFRAGKYKQPFSYEQFRMEDLTLAVFERSALDTLAPARNVGAMIHGSFGDKNVDYAIGLSNGLRDSDFEEKRNEKDVVGRVVARPFRGWAGAALSRFQFGISAAYGEETDAFDPEAFASPMRVRYFQFAEGVNAAGPRFRTSPEVAYFYGPWAFAAQYLTQRQRVESSKVPGSPSVMVPMDAFYVLTSFVLTGEHRTSYAEFIHPKNPVTLDGGWKGTGALELTLRTSGMKIGDVVFDDRYKLAEAGQVSDRLNEISVGLNWYVSRWVWVMGNFEHCWFKQPLPLGGPGGARLTNQQSIGLRTTVMW